MCGRTLTTLSFQCYARRKSALVMKNQPIIILLYPVDAGATTAILGGILGGIFSLALLTLLTVFIILAIVWYTGSEKQTFNVSTG